MNFPQFYPWLCIDGITVTGYYCLNCVRLSVTCKGIAKFPLILKYATLCVFSPNRILDRFATLKFSALVHELHYTGIVHCTAQPLPLQFLRVAAN